MPDIGTLNEGPLHASLKDFYFRQGDRVEVPVDTFVADIVRGEQLIEIQTGGFSAMRKKFDHLLDRFPILLVHPIAEQTWIIKTDEQGNQTSRRKSPKKQDISNVCKELTSFPSLLSHPNFQLDVVMINEEQLLAPTKQRARRRKGLRLIERRLLEVNSVTRFNGPQDLLQLLPPGLPETFTTTDLSRRLNCTMSHAQEIAYCLRLAGTLDAEGRDKTGIQYKLPQNFGL